MLPNYSESEMSREIDPGSEGYEQVNRFWAPTFLATVMTLVICTTAFAQNSAQTVATVQGSADLNAPEPQDSSNIRLGHFAPVRNPSTRKPLPDAPSYRALTDREKFEIFRQDATSPLTFLSAGVTAGYNSLNDRVYGSGRDGFGRNYAAAVAEHETSSFFGNYLFPKLLNQDPRFHPSEKDGFWTRSTYAASRVLITRDDYGKRTVNSSYLLGVLVSTAIGNLYRPPRYRNAGQTMMDFGSTVGGDAGMNVLKEFWPEVRDRLKPITPKRFRKMEDRLVGYQDVSDGR